MSGDGKHLMEQGGETGNIKPTERGCPAPQAVAMDTPSSRTADGSFSKYPRTLGQVIKKQHKTEQLIQPPHWAKLSQYFKCYFCD